MTSYEDQKRADRQHTMSRNIRLICLGLVISSLGAFLGGMGFLSTGVTICIAIGGWIIFVLALSRL